jgi:MFS superfamily sulfate permease-like transporter
MSYSDLARHPENEPLPHAIAFRPEASLLYVNTDSVLESLSRRLEAEAGRDIRLVVCDLSASPHMDLAGARMLHQLQLDLARRGIALRIVGARGRVRDLLRAEGIGEKVGGLDRRRWTICSAASADEIIPAHELARDYHWGNRAWSSRQCPSHRAARPARETGKQAWNACHLCQHDVSIAQPHRRRARSIESALASRVG